MPTRTRMAHENGVRNSETPDLEEQYRSVNWFAQQFDISRRHFINVMEREGAPGPLRISSRCVRYPVRETIAFLRGQLAQSTN